MMMVAFSAIWTGRLDPAALTLRNFDYVIFGYKLTQQAILNSLFLALAGATMGVMLALLQAYYLNRGNAKRSALVDAVLSLPLGIPGIILGLGFLILAIRTPLYSTLTIILDRLHRAILSVRHAHGVRACCWRSIPSSSRARAQAARAGSRRMRFVLVPLLLPGDHRRLADAVRDLHSRARRDHPALCPRDGDDQRRTRAS